MMKVLFIWCWPRLFWLLKVPPKGANMPYNPNNFDQFNATSYGGYTDERGGRRGPRDVRYGVGISNLLHLDELI